MNCFSLLIFLFFVAISGNSIAQDQKNNPFFEVQDKVYSSTECYTILKTLGEGLYGKVYLVEDSNAQQFALKSYKRHDDPIHAASLYTMGEREFLRGQDLDHPNIIKSIDYFGYGAPNFYTDNLLLNFVKGTAFSKINTGDLTCLEATKNTLALCNALSYSFDLDLMYLDLNENNIMINDQKELVIIDLASFITLEEHLSMLNAVGELFPWIENKDFLDKLVSVDSSLLYFGYFEKICDLCASILLKSKIERNERIRIQLGIKKLVFNYKEDLQEKLEIPFGKYMNDLMDFIIDEKNKQN